MARIDQGTLAVLSRCTVTGTNVNLTCGQLDRKAYEAINRVLVAMGGKWNRKAQAHIFGDDPTDILEQVLLTGEVIDLKKDLSFFPTPPDLASRLVELARLSHEDMVLEPSAGDGALAEAAVRVVGRTRIQCVELAEQNFKILNAKGFAAHHGDFLALTGFNSLSLLGGVKQFDAVLMNPPFSAKGCPQADISHVMHAWPMVRSGGRLAAIMSAGTVFRENKKAVEFRQMLDAHGRYEMNPAQAFRVSGTDVATITMVMTKP